MSIQTKKSDIIWNYIGTIVSMASGFILLPLLMRFLSGDELGLWYVYLAVANLAMMFEFGFTPTFSRNIVYVISGARRLTATGRDPYSFKKGIDWHLLNIIIRTSKLIYAAVSLLAMILLSTIGSAYISYITRNISGGSHWVSWVLFCISIVLNLYFLYSLTILRGYGDVAGENQAKTISKSGQIIISGILLFCGFGLLGASIGYLVNSLLLRGYCLIRMRRHRNIEIGRRSNKTPVSFNEIRSVVLTISHLTWRDGIVQFAIYISTQATSIICSLFLSLEQTGNYSVLLQLANAATNFAAAYPRSFFPAIQSSFAENNIEEEKNIISKGFVAYWFLYFLGVLGICIVILPLLPIIKPGTHADYSLFLVISLYMALLVQHSTSCQNILCMNEIPYMRAYIFAAVFGCFLVVFFCSVLNIGAWGIILAQFISQVIYNNWKWPSYLAGKLGSSYFSLVSKGLLIWLFFLKSHLSK